MRVMKLSWGAFAIVVVLAGACGSSNGPGGTGTAGSSGGGSAGTSGGAGTTGGAGTSGGAGNAGTTGRGGTTGGGGNSGNSGTTGSGGTGTQPIGAACANTGNCSQADGPAVCCLQNSTCVLDGQCASNPNYVPCTDDPSCMKGGWICCNAGGMRFCTKQSGCPTP